MKKLLKKLAGQNDCIHRAVFKLWEHGADEEIRRLSAEMAQDDSIADVSNIRKLRKKIDEGRSWCARSPRLANALMYGIRHAVFPFAYDDAAMPAVEHGMIFYEYILEDLSLTAKPVLATMSPYRAEIIRRFMRRPVFVVGPYVQYADPFYDAAKFEATKGKLGKTLLVFPAHSTDESSVSADQKAYASMLKNLSASYDSVLINTYWWNINDSLIKLLESEGYRIVSAGYYNDPSFLPRLKSIIQLADMAVGDSVGTHVGYCYNENTPFSLIDVKTVEKKRTLGLESAKIHVGEVADALRGGGEGLETAMRRYWGCGMRLSLAEREAICQISSDLGVLCKGDLRDVNTAADDLETRYRSSASEQDTLKARLLSGEQSSL